MAHGDDRRQQMGPKDPPAVQFVPTSEYDVIARLGEAGSGAELSSAAGTAATPARLAGRCASNDSQRHGSEGSWAGLEQEMACLLARWNGLGLDEQLAEQAADEHLFATLNRMNLETIDDSALVEVAAAADRLEAAAHAKKVAAAAHLAERRSMNPSALAAHVAGGAGVAGDELAVRLRTSHREGADLVRRAQALGGPLLATGEALERGAINAQRARVIVDGLEHVAWQVAVAVEQRVLPRAADRTVPQLRSDVARALIAVDAEEAAARARERATERHVSRPKAQTDGIASMRIEGPAGDVLALDTALHASAKSAKAAGDRRSTDQLRFDALAGVAHRALITGHLGDPDEGRALARAGGSRPSIHVTLPLDQLLPAGSYPGAQGCRPRDEAPVPELRVPRPAAGSCGTTGVPGCADESKDGAGAAAEGRADGASTAETNAEMPWPVRSTGADDEMPWPPPSTGEELTDAQVPELAGYGPISPAVARALAAGGIWRRIVTDPLTGSVLDVGHTRYRPTQAIADHVRARDQQCVRPGCSHQAQHCELDHTKAYDVPHPARGGRTAARNLGPLCQRDHQLKTHGDFTLRQSEPGIFEWTTPTGHRYRRERDGTTTPLPHRDRPIPWEAQRPPPF